MLVRRMGVYRCSRRLVMISATVNPHRRASRISIERPWMRVPRQKPLTPATGPVCISYSVASTAAPRMVIPSRTIHSFAVPREFRVELAADPPAHSGDEDTEADTLCQNSDVAICVPQTSNVQDTREEVRKTSHKRKMEGADNRMQRRLDLLLETSCGLWLRVCAQPASSPAVSHIGMVVTQYDSNILHYLCGAMPLG